MPGQLNLSVVLNLRLSFEPFLPIIPSKHKVLFFPHTTFPFPCFSPSPHNPRPSSIIIIIISIFIIFMFFQNKIMQSFTSILAFLICLFSILTVSLAGLLSQPVRGGYTIPAAPVQNPSQSCRLELSKELFGGVSLACGKDLDRSRCCPVLAAWLFAAHARSALEVSSPAAAASGDLPMMPDDSQKCVNSLHDALQSHNIRIRAPNASCDAVLCFCGIRLHQIASLTCPAAFNVSASHNVTPTSAVTDLEKNCHNSSYDGCTKCLAALHKVKGYKKESERGRSKMLNRDCQLMGLTWLLARNKTAYIPTVSAVLRAIMYSAHPRQSKCSPDQDNMPLAVDSLQLDKAHASSSPLTFWIPFIILISFVA